MQRRRTNGSPDTRKRATRNACLMRMSTCGARRVASRCVSSRRVASRRIIHEL